MRKLLSLSLLTPATNTACIIMYCVDADISLLTIVGGLPFVPLNEGCPQ